VPTAVVDHRGKGRPAFEAELGQTLAAARPDWVCLAGFMRILSAETISPYAGRMLNIHPSLLPLYPGLHTHERAIAAGDAFGGATVHQVIPALDAGPILGQARVPILPGDTAESLAARVLPVEHRLYPAVLARQIRGEAGFLTL
jgi:phosphoribosylglycinamide formyltransferase 1